jgi:hypothetical protein
LFPLPVTPQLNEPAALLPLRLALVLLLEIGYPLAGASTRITHLRVALAPGSVVTQRGEKRPH